MAEEADHIVAELDVKLELSANPLWWMKFAKPSFDSESEEVALVAEPAYLPPERHGVSKRVRAAAASSQKEDKKKDKRKG